MIHLGRAKLFDVIKHNYPSKTEDEALTDCFVFYSLRKRYVNASIPEVVDSAYHLLQCPPINKLPVVSKREPPATFEYKGVNVPLTWIPAYIPKVVNCIDKGESPTQQKIGGMQPLFMRSEPHTDTRWPSKNNMPFELVAQFLDPRPDHREEFVRLFACNIRDIMDEKDNVRLQRLPIQQPFTVLNTGIAEIPFVSGALVIKMWLKTYELSYEELRKSLSRISKDLEDAADDIREMLVKDGWKIHTGLKVGGIGNTTQSAEYTCFIQNVYAQVWGNYGSLHVSDDGDVVGDMC